jgi:hypothetical protein
MPRDEQKQNQVNTRLPGPTPFTFAGTDPFYWIPLGNSVAGTGNPATFNIGVTNAQCFFRLVILP